MEKTRRVKIVTGLKCNIQCVFCYYRDNLKAPNRPHAEIIKDLSYAWKRGIREVDFSGGEPTMHPDLPSLIAGAKSLGMERVCIISNGWRLADRTYLKSLRTAGLDEILFSVHGPDETIHDSLTSTKGSFTRISEALANAAGEGLILRTNTVVTRVNYEALNAIAEFVLPFRPDQVNFITINDWCYAKHLVDKLMLSYSEMSPKLKTACDILESRVKAVNVRYIPFCFMRGYERFVCNHKQVPYDRYEWVQRVRARLEVQNNLFRYMGIIGYGFFAGKAFRSLGEKSLADLLDESVTEALRRWNYRKGAVCRKCSLDFICDGLENSYAGKFGFKELCLFTGDKTGDPLLFKKVGKPDNI